MCDYNYVSWCERQTNELLCFMFMICMKLFFLFLYSSLYELGRGMDFRLPNPMMIRRLMMTIPDLFDCGHRSRELLQFDLNKQLYRDDILSGAAYIRNVLVQTKQDV